MNPWLVIVIAGLLPAIAWVLARARKEGRPLEQRRDRPVSTPPPANAPRAEVGSVRGDVAAEIDSNWTAPVVAKPEPESKPDAIFIGPADDPIAIVRRASHGTVVRSHPVVLTPTVRSALTPLVAQAPRALAAAAEGYMGATRLVLTFSPSATRGLISGSLELTSTAAGDGFRAIARDAASKKFVEHGVLSNQINPAAIAIAAWQIAAMVTAQKFLVEINTRLAGIELGVAAILSFLEGQERATLTASTTKLVEVANMLRHEALTPDEMQRLLAQVEALEFEALKISAHREDRLAKALHGLGPADWSALVSTEQRVSEARKEIASAAGEGAALLKSVEVRLLCVALQCAIGARASLTTERLSKIRQDLETHGYI
ncbi:MAG: hypothetical protein ACHREM_26605, partial [Polyangiales bacterium]